MGLPFLPIILMPFLLQDDQTASNFGVSALLRVGFQFKRQHGSHIILRRDVAFAQMVVPDHSELGTGTLRSILHQTGITAEQLLRVL